MTYQQCLFHEDVDVYAALEDADRQWRRDHGLTVYDQEIAGQ